jgi:hypothetical protein
MHVSRFISSLCVLLVVQTPVFAWDADDIAEIIRETELKAPPIAKLGENKLREIALSSLDVEAKWEKYARCLDMFLEGVGSDKDVDSAKVEYEKAQVTLAGKWNKTREVLPILKKQEKLAQKWKTARIERNADPARYCKAPNAKKEDSSRDASGNNTQASKTQPKDVNAGVVPHQLNETNRL